MTELVREKAKELVQKCRPYGSRIYFERVHGSDCWGTHCLMDWEKNSMYKLAKHVLASELMARIEELLNQCDRIGLCSDDAHERIHELTAQIEELKEKVC